MTHTPAPWRLDVDNGIFRVKSGAVWVAFVESERPAFDGHLIAAAPELLAALKELVRWWECDEHVDWYASEITAARAAIAKAKGESK